MAGGNRDRATVGLGSPAARWAEGESHPVQGLMAVRKRHMSRSSFSGLRIAACVLGAGLAASIGRTLPAQAQSPGPNERPPAAETTAPATGAVRIEVANLILGAPASEASFTVRLIPSDPLPQKSYVRIRGLPPQVSLSDGHAIGPGAWAVPLAALADLRIIIPTGLSGRSDVAIALVAIDGGTIAEARTKLVIAGAALTGVHNSGSPLEASAGGKPQPPSAPPSGDAPATMPALGAALPPRLAMPLPTPSPAPAPAPPPAAAKPAGPPPEVLERARTFLARGQTLLSAGDIVSARLFFQRAAEAGLWQGAMAMGTTFDPAELNRLHAVGIRADSAEARKWYERARTLGAGAAVEPLLRRLPAS